MAQAGDGAGLTEADQESRERAAEGSTGASTGRGKGKGKAFAASAQWPNKSTGPMRADVLEVLGVLKVATPLQIQRLTRPDAASDRYIRATLRDLELHQLVVCEGRANAEKSTTGGGNAGRGLWLLRGKAGLQAAGAVLEDSREMGGTASGAGKSGGGHALAVNESVIAFVRGGTTPGGAGGMSAIGDWSTEAAHPLQGNRKVIPDALLRAPMRDVSVLMLELDRYGMEASRLAAKCANYRELYRRQVRNDHPAAGTGDIPKTVPMWKQMYPGHRREGYPPLAIVFTGRADRPVSEQALLNRLEAIGEATREYWEPVRTTERYHSRDSWLDYTDAIPIVATTLSLLQQHGPQGPVWTRYGRDGMHPLTEAIKNWDTRGMYDARRKAEWDRAAEKRRRRDEARRCPTCSRLPDEVKYGTSHEPGEECDRCANKREERERKARGWDGWAQEAPALTPAEAEQAAAETLQRLEAEAGEIRSQQREDSPRGLARALFRRTPKG